MKGLHHGAGCFCYGGVERFSPPLQGRGKGVGFVGIRCVRLTAPTPTPPLKGRGLLMPTLPKPLPHAEGAYRLKGALVYGCWIGSSG